MATDNRQFILDTLCAALQKIEDLHHLLVQAKANGAAPVQPSDAGEHDVCPLCNGSGSITYGSATPVQPSEKAVRSGRYSFVCNGGCGACGVKVRPFEFERTETLEGEHIGSKHEPQIVSSCCGAEVHVYDNEADEWGAEVTLAAPAQAAPAAAPYQLNEYSTDQWWLKELEGLWGSSDYKVTDDTRRAAKVACNLARLVLPAQEIDDERT